MQRLFTLGLCLPVKEKVYSYHGITDAHYNQSAWNVLWFYCGVNEASQSQAGGIQLTPPPILFPIKLTGSLPPLGFFSTVVASTERETSPFSENIV